MQKGSVLGQQCDRFLQALQDAFPQLKRFQTETEWWSVTGHVLIIIFELSTAVSSAFVPPERCEIIRHRVTTPMRNKR